MRRFYRFLHRLTDWRRKTGTNDRIPATWKNLRTLEPRTLEPSNLEPSNLRLVPSEVRVFYAAVPRRLEWCLIAALLTALVVTRAWPFVAWSGAHFDSDQATVGLMASHIADGRAFPLYFYGQTYMLAVEAWLAAPIMALTGPTVAAVKAPLVAINVAAVLLLTWLVSRATNIRPLVCAIAALPLALPPAGVAARLVEANGGNVEPWLYVLLLWWVRDRAWAFGIVLGIGVLHREFTIFAGVALVLLDTIAGRLWTWPGARHWAVVAIGAASVRAAATAVQPFASASGPGTTGDSATLAFTNADALAARVCLDPSRWPERLPQVLDIHWPQLVGAYVGPLSDFGVHTSTTQGHAAVGWLVAALVAAGLVAGLTRRRGAHQTPAQDVGLGWYLIVVGALSTAVYALVTCSPISVLSLRYNLLGLMIPVGAIVLALDRWRTPKSVAAVAVAVCLWAALNLADVLSVTTEYRRSPPLDLRLATAEALVARGIPVAWADFRIAYHVTFLSGERVRVAAINSPRIEEYAVAAQAPGTPFVLATRCAGGDEIVTGVYLCPP